MSEKDKLSEYKEFVCALDGAMANVRASNVYSISESITLLETIFRRYQHLTDKSY